MARWRRLGRRPLRWALLARAVAGAAAWTSQRTAKDAEASRLAVQAAEEECAKVDVSGLDRGASLDALRDAVGGSNAIREALVESTSLHQFTAKLREQLDVGWAVTTAGPFVFSLLLVVVWLSCCWTACPCCRCCRCCNKQRRTSLCLRIIVLTLLIGIVIGMVVCAFLAYRGKDNIEDGRNTVMCSTARILNSTLNGNAEHSFMGMLPMLDELSRVCAVMDDNSTFLNYVSLVMDNTVEIQRATYLAEQMTALLAAMLSEPANLHPPSAQASLRPLHRCELCANLATPVAELSTAVASGSAAALAAVRAEVARQLSPASRSSLRGTFNTSLLPLRDASATVRDTSHLFLKEDVRHLLDTTITLASVLIISLSAVVFLIGACGLTAGALLATRELDEDKEWREVENPWHPLIAPSACCTWCWGWLYGFLVFFVGGALAILSVPLGGTCLLLRDLDGALLRDVLPAAGLELDTSGGTFQMLTEVIDSCFSLGSDAGNQSLMDIIHVEEGGNRTSLRQKLQGQTSSLLEDRFAALATAPAAGAGFLSDAGLVGMLALLRDTPVDQAIVAQEEVRRHALFSGLFLDPRNDVDSLAAAVGSSLACGGASALSLVNLTGRLQGFTSSPLLATTPPIGCPGAGKVVCNQDPSTGAAIACPAVGSDACSACQAGNSFMELKAELFNLNTFRCDILQTASGSDCDPMDMVKVAGVWQNDCIQTDQNGEPLVRVKRKTCTLGEFTAYMSDWQTRLTQVFTRLDEAVPAVQNAIAGNLQDIVRRDILQPIDRMASSAECGFLKAEYAAFLDGLCYQGAVGFHQVARAYVSSGVLAVLLVFTSYGIWRRAADNREGWDKANLKGTEEVTIVAMDERILPVVPEGGGSTPMRLDSVRTFGSDMEDDTTTCGGSSDFKTPRTPEQLPGQPSVD